jgi:hypothetical protein
MFLPDAVGVRAQWRGRRGGLELKVGGFYLSALVAEGGGRVAAGSVAVVTRRQPCPALVVTATSASNRDGQYSRACETRFRKSAFVRLTGRTAARSRSCGL